MRRGLNFAGTQRMLSESECDKEEAGEGSEASMKDFARKASILQMFSLWEGGDKKGNGMEERRRVMARKREKG